MDSRRKVLILYASAGHGHEKAALALFEALQGSQVSEEVRILDALTLALPGVRRFYRWAYFTQIRRLPWLWGFFYYSTDLRWVYGFVRHLRRLINAVLGLPLHRLLVREDPSVIISTHFLATEIAGWLKSRGRIHSKIITVITDYLPHEVWMAPGVDVYTAACAETRAALLERGVSDAKIRVTGIPIEEKFLESRPREELLKKFALAEGLFTVLITGGGAGLGGGAEIAERLSRLGTPIQILLVCGTNRGLFERMQAFSHSAPRLKIFGFVGNMQELMEAADVVIGKGGGLTVTESLAKGKPLILFRSVLGQERRNDAIVEKYGAGFATNSVEKVIQKVSELATNAEFYSRMKEGVRRLSRPDAAQTILGLARDGR